MEPPEGSKGMKRMKNDCLARLRYGFHNLRFCVVREANLEPCDPNPTQSWGSKKNGTLPVVYRLRIYASVDWHERSKLAPTTLAARDDLRMHALADSDSLAARFEQA
jgi:hypothetical protein